MTYQPQTVWVGGSPYAGIQSPKITYDRDGARQEREAMLAYIRANPGCSRDEVVKHVAPHLDRKTYDRRIRMLCDEGRMTKTRVPARYGTQTNSVMLVTRYHPIRRSEK